MVGGRRKGGGREGEGGRKGRREGGCRDAYVQRSGRAVRLPRHEHDGVVEALQAETLLLVGGGILRTVTGTETGTGTGGSGGGKRTVTVGSGGGWLLSYLFRVVCGDILIGDFKLRQ